MNRCCLLYVLARLVSFLWYRSCVIFIVTSGDSHHKDFVACQKLNQFVTILLMRKHSEWKCVEKGTRISSTWDAAQMEYLHAKTPAFFIGQRIKSEVKISHCTSSNEFEA